MFDAVDQIEIRDAFVQVDDPINTTDPFTWSAILGYTSRLLVVENKSREKPFIGGAYRGVSITLSLVYFT